MLFPAEEKKCLAEEKARENEEQNQVIEAEKKEAASALNEALPALEPARIALQDLQKSDLTEIRSGATNSTAFRQKQAQYSFINPRALLGSFRPQYLFLISS